MARLDLVKARARLPMREMPYWMSVMRGRAIGYRARPNGGTWIARIAHGGKLPHQRLGDASEMTYEQALKAAQEWWARIEGGAPRRYDVLAAIEQYAQTKVTDATPREAARVWRDVRYVGKHLSGEFLAREVASLKAQDLENWRGGLDVKTTSKRRIYTVLLAALRNAHRLLNVGDPADWRRVKAIKIPKASRSRTFIPTDAEIASLLKRAPADTDFGKLVRAALLIGARYGELIELEAGDFDPGKGVLNIRISKTGPREVLLSSEAVAFFAEQIKGKLPRARVFTCDGAPWGGSMQSRRMREATGSRLFTFYALRHRCLSRQLRSGIPSALVARNAGTSEKILREHYHKLIPSDDRSIFDRVGALG